MCLSEGGDDKQQLCSLLGSLVLQKVGCARRNHFEINFPSEILRILCNVEQGGEENAVSFRSSFDPQL